MDGQGADAVVGPGTRIEAQVERSVRIQARDVVSTNPVDLGEITADDQRRFPSVLAGPTCDSIDLIDEDIPLPELQIGDVVVGQMMGAYTAASATEFNLLKKAKFVVINETVAVVRDRSIHNAKQFFNLGSDQSFH